MKEDIDDLLKHFFRSEELAACRILGRRKALARIRLVPRYEGAGEDVGEDGDVAGSAERPVDERRDR
jgi:hypothetical protein